MSGPVIRFDHVGQTFVSRDGQRLQALAGIDLAIERHEFVAIIGPSGCGKSTLLRQVAGLLRPSEGSVSVNGLTVSEPRDDIGLVFQRPTLLPWLKVLDNVTFPMKHKTGRVDEETRARGRELLAKVGLAEFASRRPDELSGGMQQRVAIARALLQDPDILLMDEPFSALDALTRDEMALELLRIMDATPKTVLFVTHSIPEALLLADRIVVMTARPGQVREVLQPPFARPRGLETMENPLFNTLANEIRQQVFARKSV
jgi:NitT/TauT family transport system ATP-binding protein